LALDLNFYQNFKKIISEASIVVRKFELLPALAGGYNLDIVKDFSQILLLIFSAKANLSFDSVSFS
jgi:hypothetical protein